MYVLGIFTRLVDVTFHKVLFDCIVQFHGDISALGRKNRSSLTFSIHSEPVNHRVEGTEGEANQKGSENKVRQHPLGESRLH